MKKIVIAFIIIAIGAGTYGMLNNNKEAKNKEKTQIIDENKPPLDIQRKLEEEKNYLAKDFELKDTNGKTVSLEDFKGKNIMLNFWASWCVPCKSEMPDLQKLQDESKNDKDFEIVTINVGESSKKAKEFLEKNNLKLNTLLDDEAEVSMDYGASVLPTTFLIDEKGYVKKIVKGAMNFETMKDYKEGLVNDMY
ncbi:MAG: TlpA disulfide reductase family protein [Clostridium chrysemydis]|uniref:TlpA disulfide reductase family protein n=1 Tax=Clostridium chrysemydis TaxID=2665504 RepID=UPI003F3CABA5